MRPCLTGRDTTPGGVRRRGGPGGERCEAGHCAPSATIRSRRRGQASANAGSSGRSATSSSGDPAQLDALGVGDRGVDRRRPRRRSRSCTTSRGAAARATRAGGPPAGRSRPPPRPRAGPRPRADSPGMRAPPGTPHVPPWSLHSARCCRTTATGVPSASRRTSSSPAAPCRPQCRCPHAHSTQPSPGWRWCRARSRRWSADDLADGGAGAHAGPDAGGQRRSRCPPGAPRAAAPSSWPRAPRRGRPRPRSRPRRRRP